MGDGETKGGGVIILRGFGCDVWANPACTTCGGSGCARKARIDPADIDELRLVAAYEGMRREAVAGVVEKAPPTVDYERVDTYEIKRDEKAIAASHAMMAQAREQTDGLLFKIIVGKPAPGEAKAWCEDVAAKIRPTEQ